MRFDVSGVERFWAVQEALRAGEEFAEEQWQELFSTPGCEALTRSEFTPEQLRSRFELAYVPHRAREREECLQRPPGYKEAVLTHLLEVVERRAELESFVEQRLTRELAKEAIALARPWLPASGLRGQVEAAMVVFEFDGRGYDPVVLDVRAAEAMGADLVFFLAHEFHHHFRNDLLEFDRHADHAPYNDLVWVLDQLHAEGTANQVDKRRWLDRRKEKDSFPPSYPRGFLEAVDRSPEVIAMLDAGLARMADPDSDHAAEAREMRRQLPSAGHPTGFFMADLIQARLGRQALLNSLGNPFQFASLTSSRFGLTGRNDSRGRPIVTNNGVTDTFYLGG